MIQMIDLQSTREADNVTIRLKVLVHLASINFSCHFETLGWNLWNEYILHFARIVIKWRSSTCQIRFKELNKPFGEWVNDLLIFHPVSQGRVGLQQKQSE